MYKYDKERFRCDYNTVEILRDWEIKKGNSKSLIT